MMPRQGWERAREPYDCETCGYPMDAGESVYWRGDHDTVHCSERCARNWQDTTPPRTTYHGGGGTTEGGCYVDFPDPYA